MEANAPPPVLSPAKVSRSTAAICRKSFISAWLRSRVTTSTTCSRRTVTTSSPRWERPLASGNRSRTRSTRACDMAALSLLDGGGAVELRLDLLLQDLEAVEHLLGSRRAAGHVDVHRNDAVGALQGGVVVVEAARAGADAEGHHPFRFAHLLVDALQDRALLDVDGADDHQEVGLARGESRKLGAEAGDVVAPRHRRHVLHAAAGGDEGILKDAVLAGPAERVGEVPLEEADRLLQTREQDGDVALLAAQPRRLRNVAFRPHHRQRLHGFHSSAPLRQT